MTCDNVPTKYRNKPMPHASKWARGEVRMEAQVSDAGVCIRVLDDGNGVPDDALLLCGFHQSYKISAAVFDRWCELLERLPDAVLWLLQWNTNVRDSLLAGRQGREGAVRLVVLARDAGALAARCRATGRSTSATAGSSSRSPIGCGRGFGPGIMTSRAGVWKAYGKRMDEPELTVLCNGRLPLAANAAQLILEPTCSRSSVMFFCHSTYGYQYQSHLKSTFIRSKSRRLRYRTRWSRS